MPTPTQSITNALAAYANAAKSDKVESPAGEMPGSDFHDLVTRALSHAEKVGRAGEGISIEAVADKADINNVVTAVAEAELTLQTVVAIRDKVVGAYREIIRMPI